MWSQRRRRGSTPRIDQDKQALLREVMRRGSIYLAAMHPAPYTPYELYKELFTADERVALKLLVTRLPSLLRYGDTFFIHLNMKNAIRVDLPKSLPCPKTGSVIYPASGATISLDHFPEEMRTRLRTWAKEYITTHARLMQMYADIEAVMKPCGTFGQVVRLWPALAVFFPSHRKDLFMQAKVKSRYPDAVMIPKADGSGFILNEAFIKAPVWDELLASLLVFSNEMPADQPVYVVNDQ